MFKRKRAISRKVLKISEIGRKPFVDSLVTIHILAAAYPTLVHKSKVSIENSGGQSLAIQMHAAGTTRTITWNGSVLTGPYEPSQ